MFMKTRRKFITMHLKPGYINILNEKVSLHCALHLFFITENISKTFSAFDKYYQYKTIVDIATVKYDLYICTATSCKQRFKDYSVCL